MKLSTNVVYDIRIIFFERDTSMWQVAADVSTFFAKIIKLPNINVFIYHSKADIIPNKWFVLVVLKIVTYQKLLGIKVSMMTSSKLWFFWYCLKSTSYIFFESLFLTEQKACLDWVQISCWSKVIRLSRWRNNFSASTFHIFYKLLWMKFLSSSKNKNIPTIQNKVILNER